MFWIAISTFRSIVKYLFYYIMKMCQDIVYEKFLKLQFLKLFMKFGTCFSEGLFNLPVWLDYLNLLSFVLLHDNFASIFIKKRFRRLNSVINVYTQSLFSYIIPSNRLFRSRVTSFNILIDFFLTGMLLLSSTFYKVNNLNKLYFYWSYLLC